MKKPLSFTAALLALLLLLAGCASPLSAQGTDGLPWEAWESGTTYHPSLSLSEEESTYLSESFQDLQERRHNHGAVIPQISFDSRAEGYGTHEFDLIMQQLCLLPSSAIIDFQGSKGCTDLTCTDPDHFHWCPPGCNEAEHYHAKYTWKQFQ